MLRPNGSCLPDRRWGFSPITPCASWPQQMSNQSDVGTFPPRLPHDIGGVHGTTLVGDQVVQVC